MIDTQTRSQLSPSAQPPAHTSSDDWDALFSAVIWRLRQTAGTPAGVARAAAAPPEEGRFRTDVLDCVEALEQLRGMLAAELNRSLEHERRVRDADACLALLRNELASAMGRGRQARHRGLHDELTALPNRHFFRERLGRALTPAEGTKAPPAVLYLDLDGFQPINDTHGDEIGDELLRIVAMRLSRAMRSEDVVSRLGGDEFACLLADAVSREQLSFVACKLFDAVSAPVKISGLQLTVRPSIGIAMSPQDGNTAGLLLRNADIAMVHAKRSQCGYAFFDSCATK